LCRRFEIDASSRTIHGALLDAKILAQVYLAMTGGQSNLFQETDSNKIQKVGQSLVKRKNKEGEKLTIIYANKDEIEEHNNYFEN
ncbi:MAG: DNA polymerase III subunit epsilon, partial [Gemmatimonadota bacterium]|nr:DNA polymerase III subunit epsilon [Gemmatimonadota bacterium]